MLFLAEILCSDIQSDKYNTASIVGFGLLGFIKKLLGSGWPKWPQVGSNLGSGFDPTHAYSPANSYLSEFIFIYLVRILPTLVSIGSCTKKIQTKNQICDELY